MLYYISRCDYFMRYNMITMLALYDYIMRSTTTASAKGYICPPVIPSPLQLPLQWTAAGNKGNKTAFLLLHTHTHTHTHTRTHARTLV